MRAAAVATALAAAFLLAGAASCDTAGEVRSGVDEARSSAASVGAGAREACRASEDELKTLGDLSSRLADNPDLRVQLAPQVRQTVDRLAAEVGSRAELQPVVLAARALAAAVGEANRDAVEVAARQAVLAVRSAQGVCRLAR
jgi:hypothetical protein